MEIIDRRLARHIVIFDLDETLTRKGTWGRFVFSTLRGHPFKKARLALGMAFNQIVYKLGMKPREFVKERMMRQTLSGRCKQELRQLAENFARAEADSGLRPQAQSIIEHHRSKGDRLMIASAAVDLIVEPMAKFLDIDEYVCTAMAYTSQGVLDVKLGGQNCYGCGKLEMVKAYLDQCPQYQRGERHITVYSDSCSDLDILAWADRGVAVHPTRKLANCAKEYDLEIQYWN